MSWVILILFGLVAAYAQTTSTALAAPAYCLGLASWCMVNGSDKDMFIRVWLIGFLCDCMQPQAGMFYQLSFLVLALGFLPLRSLVFKRSMSGWFIWTFIACCVVSVIDATSLHVSGGLGLLITRACFTGALVVLLGVIANPLPERFHPFGNVGV